jgi:hypothetical protein
MYVAVPFDGMFVLLLYYTQGSFRGLMQYYEHRLCGMVSGCRSRHSHNSEYRFLVPTPEQHLAQSEVCFVQIEVYESRFPVTAASQSWKSPEGTCVSGSILRVVFVMKHLRTIAPTSPPSCLLRYVLHTLFSSPFATHPPCETPPRSSYSYLETCQISMRLEAMLPSSRTTLLGRHDSNGR